MSKATEILDKYINAISDHNFQYYSHEEVIEILLNIKHELNDD